MQETNDGIAPAVPSSFARCVMAHARRSGSLQIATSPALACSIHQPRSAMNLSSRHASPLFAIVAAAALMVVAMPASAAGSVDCKLTFNLSGWSVFYKTGSGSGTVRCDNGQSMAVRIRTKGGGLTFGKTRIDNGRGEFSGVRRIEDVLGTYVTAEAHAGAGKSAKAQAMVKGDVALALAGKGEGWDIGVAFGKFVISR
jgi:hypothetical protein